MSYLFTLKEPLLWGKIMKVNVSQLIPGCILQEDIIGKTGKPIVAKQTTLTKEHINILQKFLITDVHVFNELSDGSRFIARHPVEEANNTSEINISLQTHFNNVVHAFKDQFQVWEMEQKIDLVTLRQTVLPLFDRAKQMTIKDLISLKHDVSKNSFYSRQILASLVTIVLAKDFGYDRKGDLYQIGLASLLSDSGFIKLSEDLFEQAKQLSMADDEAIKQHPVLSYRLIENSPLLSQVAKLSVLQHEERLDRSGYPLKLGEADIHRYAKIIAVSDEFTKALYHALQKNKSPVIEAIKAVQAQRLQKLDAKIVGILINQLTANR